MSEPARAVDSPVDVLRRWEDSGALWRVVTTTGSGVTVALLTCDAGEEVDRLTSDDPDLLRWITDRTDGDCDGGAPVTRPR